MAQEASNQAIGEQLVITVGTVKSHINHILAKLNASPGPKRWRGRAGWAGSISSPKYIFL